MDTIGEQLQKARLQRGLTIEELQITTKIQRRYLEAIEMNDFDAMPSDYYAKTFIRQYAEAVGVNPHPLIRRFDGKPEKNTDSFSPNIPVQGSRKEKYSQPNSKKALVQQYIPITLLTLVVVAIVGTIIYAIRLDSASGPLVPKPDKTTIVGSSQSKESETDSKNDEQSTTDSLSESADSTEKKEPKATFTFESDTGDVVTFKGSQIKQPLTLSFKGLEGPAWIGLQASGSGELFYQYTLQPGESLESEVPDGITAVDIIVGAANNLQLSANGADIPFNKEVPVTGKKVVTLILDPSDTTDNE